MFVSVNLLTSQADSVLSSVAKPKTRAGHQEKKTKQGSTKSVNIMANTKDLEKQLKAAQEALARQASEIEELKVSSFVLLCAVQTDLQVVKLTPQISCCVLLCIDVC